jgi:zona occludens toxin (predicted ATPase)
MANQRIPNDPDRSNLSDDDFGRAARYDTELQADPELEEGPASSGKIALLAVVVALVLGAVFYGLNNSSVNQAGTAPPPAQTAQQNQPASPAAPPGMRDVTPRGNSDQGMTTGAASTRPQMPPATAPTQMNQPANPPANNAPGK